MKKSKNNKKINTELNFEGYKDALETAFKRFLDAPTNKSLKDFIDYSQNYREAWILKNAAPGYQDNFEQGRDVRHSNADVKDPRVDVDPMILHVDELSKQFVKETVFKADSDNREEGKDGGSSIASNYFIWPQLEQDYLQHSILGTRPSNSKDWKRANCSIEDGILKKNTQMQKKPLGGPVERIFRLLPEKQMNRRCF